MTDTQRLNIAVAGRMNAGKSTFTNALTQNAVSIVDSTPGTTADAKVTLMEIHGLGACRIFDTAGADELGVLGAKKRRKTIKLLHQSDVVCLIQRPGQDDSSYLEQLVNAYEQQLRSFEKESFDSLQEAALFASETNRTIIKECESKKKKVLQIINDEKHGAQIERVAKNVIKSNLQLVSAHELALSIKDVTKVRILSENQVLPLKFLKNSSENDKVLLVIPLDVQSPKLRLLRPQSQAIEALLSTKRTVISFRLDLNKARGFQGLEAQAQEFAELDQLVTKNNVKLVITDSQAMDIVQKLKTPLTTFSVMQMHLLLGKKLFDYTTESTRKLNQLIQDKPAKLNILISEACQHDRITENCEDIGTKQIPQILKKMFPATELSTTYSFGKDDQLMDNPFDLVIHCGGCMISGQQMKSRVNGFRDKGIPVVSYGSFLSLGHGGMKSLERVTKIWE